MKFRAEFRVVETRLKAIRNRIIVLRYYDPVDRLLMYFTHYNNTFPVRSSITNRSRQSAIYVRNSTVLSGALVIYARRSVI